MKEYKFTDYFENEVLRKRPFLKKEWCIRVLENPSKVGSSKNKIVFDFGVRSKNWRGEFFVSSLLKTN